MDRGRSRRSRSQERSRSRSRGRDRSRDRPAGARLADKRVYISNIPYDSRWQDIKDLFRKEVGEVSFVELFNDENEKPRGCGIIEFDNGVTAKKGIEKMHRFELGGRKIVVKEDYDVERDKFGRIVTGGNAGRRDGGGGGVGGGNPNAGGGGGGGGGHGGGERERSHDRNDRNNDRNDWNNERRVEQSSNQGAGANWKYGNTYGLSSPFLESLGIDGPLISRVFISNLDFRVDEKKLKEVFRLAGRVIEVDLNKDKDGKSRGHGVIEFEHPVEAVQAISMLNNQQLFDRRMHVKMDRLADPLSDLAKNKLPEGLKGIGMGLGMNGQPLVEVSKSVSGNTSNGQQALIGGGGGSNGTGNNLNNPINTLAAMNMSTGMGNLASLMASQQSLDMGGMPSAAAAAAAAAAANAFGVAAGIGPMGALNAAAANQFANIGGGNPANLAAALQNSSGMGLGLQGSQGGGGGNPMNLMGGGGGQMGNAAGMAGSNIGTAAGAPTQPSPFQTNSNAGQGGNQGFRDMDYGYSTSVYSTPSSNYNTAYQREKQNFNGVSGGNTSSSGGTGSTSNTVIVANLPPSCTWQMLKTKFRECGEVVFAEMRDKSTGIVRFASERDAERAVKVFDQSRVDGRIVEVRFL